MKVKVGILGSGDVAKALASGFHQLGHEVKLGSRSPEKLADWVAGKGSGVAAGTFSEAAAFGDLIVLATLGTATEQAVRMAGLEHFQGKTVIDTTNPLAHDGDRVTGLSVGWNDSQGEQVQRLLPAAKVVKAFNTVGNPLMFQPQLPGGPPDMFICGNDAEAKKLVTQVCQHFGWGTVDLGGIESSRYLEPMCMAWVMDGMISGNWAHAFKVLRK